MATTKVAAKWHHVLLRPLIRLRRPSPMTPIQDMLHRIQWDPEFGNARFMIGYYDRVADRIVRIPFQRVHLKQGERFSFDVVDESGKNRMIPFHRVREVWRNRTLIWQRKPA